LLKNLWEKGYSFCYSLLTIDEFWYGLVFLTRKNKKTDAPFASFADMLEKVTEELFMMGTPRFISLSFDKENIGKTLGLIKKFNLRPRDALHLQTMIENNIDEFATFDNDFNEVFRQGLIKKAGVSK